MRTLYLIHPLFLIVCILPLLQNCQGSEKKENSSSANSPQTMDVAEFEEKLNNTSDKIILDVRTPSEYHEGHLSNSVLIDFRNPDFMEQVSKLDKSKTVFVYCAAGGRSEKAANILKDLGFNEVYNLHGGINEWKAASKPVVKD